MNQHSNQTHGALTEEFERSLTVWMCTDIDAWRKPYRNRLGKHWRRSRSTWLQYQKCQQSRRERTRARLDPECAPKYNKHYGWYW